jgi:anti-sigma factor (TIGR02949 family)
MEINNQSSGERKLQCSDVTRCFQLLESILDGELGDNGKEALKDKLDKCQPCFEHFHLEQAIREVLKTKCTKQPVPTELADSIRQMIQESK